MKNITLSAQDSKIDMLRDVAKASGKTVNDLFREWLDKDVAKQQAKQRQALHKAFLESVQRINYIKLDRKYTREEMNQR